MPGYSSYNLIPEESFAVLKILKSLVGILLVETKKSLNVPGFLRILIEFGSSFSRAYYARDIQILDP
jgi:hypothetical protein